MYVHEELSISAPVTAVTTGRQDLREQLLLHVLEPMNMIRTNKGNLQKTREVKGLLEFLIKTDQVAF